MRRSELKTRLQDEVGATGRVKVWWDDRTNSETGRPLGFQAEIRCNVCGAERDPLWRVSRVTVHDAVRTWRGHVRTEEHRLGAERGKRLPPRPRVRSVWEIRCMSPEERERLSAQERRRYELLEVQIAVEAGRRFDAQMELLSDPEGLARIQLLGAGGGWDWEDPNS